MNLKRLLAKVDYFFMKTALINVPQEVYQPVIDFIKECIADLKSNPESQIHKESFIFPLEIMPYHNNMTEEHFNKYFIKKYIDNNEPIPEEVYKYKNLKNVMIFVQVFIGEGTAFWQKPKGKLLNTWASDDTLVIGKLTFPIKPNFPINNIDNIVIHELTHFMQTYINLMTNNMGTDIGGLVARKSRTPGATPYGYLKDSNRVSHFQQDIEYYPLIRDVIEVDFPKLRAKMPEVLYRDAISTFVGEKSIEEFKSIVRNLQEQGILTETEANNILNIDDSILQSIDFVEWRDNNPQKYKSAIKEFYKNIN